MSCQTGPYRAADRRRRAFECMGRALLLRLLFLLFLCWISLRFPLAAAVIDSRPRGAVSISFETRDVRKTQKKKREKKDRKKEKKTRKRITSSTRKKCIWASTPSTSSSYLSIPLGPPPNAVRFPFLIRFINTNSHVVEFFLIDFYQLILFTSSFVDFHEFSH